MAEPANIPDTNLMQDKAFLYSFRQAMLMMVDAVERALRISPTTAEIRAMYKASHPRQPISEDGKV